MLNSLSKFVPFGSAMPKLGISKFSAKNGDTRIRVLSTSEQDFLITKVHYLKGVGSFHCFNGSCCQAVLQAPEGDANTTERAILPIGVVTPSVSGGVSIEYMYLPLSEKKYSQLVALNQNVGDITSYDMLVQCTDEKYQNYTILPLVGQASMVLTEEEMPKAQAFLASYRAKIMDTLGKKLDENSFAVARAKSIQQAANSVGVQFTPSNTATQTFAQPTPTPALPTEVAPPVAIPQVTVAPVTPTPTPVAEAQPVPVVPQSPTNVGAPTFASQPAPETESVTTDINWADFMNN